MRVVKIMLLTNNAEFAEVVVRSDRGCSHDLFLGYGTVCPACRIEIDNFWKSRPKRQAPYPVGGDPSNHSIFFCRSFAFASLNAVFSGEEKSPCVKLRLQIRLRLVLGLAFPVLLAAEFSVCHLEKLAIDIDVSNISEFCWEGSELRFDDGLIEHFAL